MSSIADRSLMSMQLRTHVFQERTISTALRATRDALWPGGIMNPPRIPPTPSEVQEIRRNAEKAALNALPGILPPCVFSSPSLHSVSLLFLSVFYISLGLGFRISDFGFRISVLTAEDILRSPLLGTSKQQQRDNIRELFDLLGSKECNKHLLMFLLDLLVVRLVPELGEQTPKELFDLRTV